MDLINVIKTAVSTKVKLKIQFSSLSENLAQIIIDLNLGNKYKDFALIIDMSQNITSPKLI